MIYRTPLYNLDKQTKYLFVKYPKSSDKKKILRTGNVFGFSGLSGGRAGYHDPVGHEKLRRFGRFRKAHVLSDRV